MAKELEEIKRTNLFIKSSTDDFQDPVFLTFRVDFFPPQEQYPKFDLLTCSSLLRDPTQQRLYDSKTEEIVIEENPVNQNQVVEYSTETWLREYYQGAYKNTLLNPVIAIQQFKKRLKEIQDSPWYFQSIQGIGDLWKGLHKVKQGSQATSLIFNCIDSIKQPLTEMAESYRYAMYDGERLSYRVPDNLRWFDMTIDLVEIRDIVDNSGDFYVSDGGVMTSGLRVVRFRCKLCEFDFSEFMGGSQSDHKVSTEEKSFSPSFKINVGWVIQEPVSLTDAHAFRQMNLFSGVLDDLNSKLTRFLQNAVRLPGAIVGSVLTEIQTLAERSVMGNAYSGVNKFLTDMNAISGNITSRPPVVGPPIVSNIGDDVYPGSLDQNSVSSIGKTYDTQQEELPKNMGAAYPTETKLTPPPMFQQVYSEPAQSNLVDDLGTTYSEPAQSNLVDDLGDVYPTLPNPIEISNINDTYQVNR